MNVPVILLVAAKVTTPLVFTVILAMVGASSFPVVMLSALPFPYVILDEPIKVGTVVRLPATLVIVPPPLIVKKPDGLKLPAVRVRLVVEVLALKFRVTSLNVNEVKVVLPAKFTITPVPPLRFAMLIVLPIPFNVVVPPVMVNVVTPVIGSLKFTVPETTVIVVAFIA